MSRHIYFLGIGGTLMGSLALLAREKGYRVSGIDKVLYPPMSDQLADADIELYRRVRSDTAATGAGSGGDGNAGLPRGHPGVEYVLDNRLPYTSGAEWLGGTSCPIAGCSRSPAPTAKPPPPAC